MAHVQLATLQRRVVDFASPPDVPVSTLFRGAASSRDFLLRGAGDTMGAPLCQSIRVRDASYYNFDVAGLLLILTLGSVIVLTNLMCIPGIVFWARRRRCWSWKRRVASEFSRNEWLEGHLLPLQCTALASQGIGPWQIYGDGDVPVTDVGQTRFGAEKMWESRCVKL